jgi:hypothetical protein
MEVSTINISNIPNIHLFLSLLAEFRKVYA